MAKPANIVVNPGHPLYANLVELHPFTEAEGDTAGNLIDGGRDFTRIEDENNVGEWVASSEGGRAWSQPGTADADALGDTVRTVDETLAAGTVIAVIKIPTLGYSGWWGQIDLTAVGGSRLNAGVDTQLFDFSVGINTVQSGESLNHATALPETWFPIAIAWTTSQIRSRMIHPVDGLRTLSKSVSWPGVVVSENTRLWLGRDISNSWSEFAITWHQRFDVALSNSQIDSFLANPYQSVQPTPRANYPRMGCGLGIGI